MSPVLIDPLADSGVVGVEDVETGLVDLARVSAWASTATAPAPTTPAAAMPAVIRPALRSALSLGGCVCWVMYPRVLREAVRRLWRE